MNGVEDLESRLERIKLEAAATEQHNNRLESQHENNSDKETCKTEDCGGEDSEVCNVCSKYHSCRALASILVSQLTFIGSWSCHPVCSVLKLSSYFSVMLRFFPLYFLLLSHVQRKLGRRPVSRSTAATSRQLRVLWKLFRLWLRTKATWHQLHSGWNLDYRSCRT